MQFILPSILGAAHFGLKPGDKDSCRESAARASRVMGRVGYCGHKLRLGCLQPWTGSIYVLLDYPTTCGSRAKKSTTNSKRLSRARFNLHFDALLSRLGGAGFLLHLLMDRSSYCECFRLTRFTLNRFQATPWNPGLKTEEDLLSRTCLMLKLFFGIVLVNEV